MKNDTEGKPIYTYEQYPDEYIHEKIVDGPIPGSFLLDHSSKATVGWINIKGRSKATNFEISINQISKNALNNLDNNYSYIIGTFAVVTMIILGTIFWYHYIH